MWSKGANLSSKCAKTTAEPPGKWETEISRSAAGTVLTWKWSVAHAGYTGLYTTKIRGQ
jgi:hypothetical protein